MISFSHLANCQQIINLGDLDTSLSRPFITDTRRFKNNEAFIAIPGQKVNPLDLLNDLLLKGCEFVFYEENEINEKIVEKYQISFAHVKFIAVRNSIAFIQELAHLHIKNWIKTKGHTLFAISGSNGKTTHKEMLSHIMETVLPGQIVFTQKNNNNHLGVPLTLLDVGPQTSFVILELGSNHPGEIKFLCELALPNAGLTTNIGATHLEFFGTENEVFLEEGYLYYAVRDNTAGEGMFLINNDDPYLKGLIDTAGSKRFGSDTSCELPLSYLADGARLGDFKVHNPHITGDHNKANLITCAFIARHFYPNKEQEIVQAAASFKPTANRSQWIKVNNSEIYLDAYNANPSSMKVALKGFKDHLKSLGQSLDHSLVVLGDMNELGEHSPTYHQELGAFATELGFTHIAFIGRFAGDYLRGAPQARAYASAQAFRDEYQKTFLEKYHYHFIKGSRSLQLESLFDIT